MRRKDRELKMLLLLNFVERNRLKLVLPFLLSHHLFEASPSSWDHPWPSLTMTVQPPCLHRPWGPRHFNHIYGMAMQPDTLQKALMKHIVTQISPQSCVCTSSGLREAYVQSMLKNLKNNTENKQALNVCDISNEATDWVQLLELERDSFHISGINSRFCSSGNQFLQTILCTRSSLWRLVKPFAPNFKNNPFPIIAIYCHHWKMSKG